MSGAIDPNDDRTISTAQARRFYNRVGGWLDTQRFYEDPALENLVRFARFEDARSVFEFGCGTGRFASQLLGDVLPPGARYTGVDISPAMVRLTTERLRPWSERIDIRLTDGAPPSAERDASYDRFVATYVLDLLAVRQIGDLLMNAHRILVDGGLLCTVALTYGHRGLARLVTGAWTWLYRRNPVLVGGCRPLRVADHLLRGGWKVEHSRTMTTFGMTSDVTIARKMPAEPRVAGLTDDGQASADAPRRQTLG